MKGTLPLILCFLLAMAGCANLTHDQQRTLSGGAIGAGAGGAIGLIAGPPGFLVGALVGGAAGSAGSLYWDDIVGGPATVK